jgi:DNA-binding NarL/FixJ family response regulator
MSHSNDCATAAQVHDHPFRSYLVVEDVTEAREWLVKSIAEVFGATAYGASTLGQGRAWLRMRDPGETILALVDLGLPDGNGATLIREIVSRHPNAMVVVTTVFDDNESLMEALAAGAQGYLLKDQDGPGIQHRLARIEHGDVPISPGIARRLLQRFLVDGPSQAILSPRETEVLRLIGRGLKAGEVANTLSISPQTVTTHVKTIYRKLDITSRAEAALEARKRGLT